MYISEDAVDILWDEMEQFSWNELYNIVENQKGNTRWLKISTRNILLNELIFLSKSGEKFPQSPEEMCYVLNRNAAPFLNTA